MKVKTDFVTNSSSSSFIINKYDISEKQRDLIFDVHDNINFKEDPWDLSEDEHTIKGWTFMDNFDMRYYLEVELGIPRESIEWGD